MEAAGPELSLFMEIFCLPPCGSVILILTTFTATLSVTLQVILTPSPAFWEAGCAETSDITGDSLSIISK